MTEAGRALLDRLEKRHEALLTVAHAPRDKFEQEEWADIIGDNPVWLVREALPAIEVEAVAEWLASPEAERRLAEADHEQIKAERGGCGDHMESFDDHMSYHAARARAILAALREQP